MAKSLKKLIGKIHPGDCIEGMKKVPDQSVQLVFADPPFNIGYDYDEYDDRLESQKYVDWSHQWMSEVHRILDDRGTFWLAIGDEYAAELKLEAQKVGFHPRSWVIWYYTFGVHCKTKFTRSHAHLFYFVKDPKEFTFHPQAVAVPSARQLVYGDKRANPKGRMPDDTWILRPQDCVDGFTPDEDMWYFPRVAGTFKERAGFHGCQMPEQLMGRIIRACSNPGDVVVDPFSGSSTTITVAKKLGREFFSFELSKDYVKLGTKRVEGACVGDVLDGSEEPKVSAPATNGSRKTAKKKQVTTSPELPNLLFDLEEAQNESQSIVEAFADANRGFSVDRLIADPLLNEDFQLQCDRRSVPGTGAERNRFLFRLRKSGKLKRAGIETSKRTSIGWDQMEPFLFAAEIAWRQVSDLYANMSLDELLSDPRLAAKFDKLAKAYSPGFSPLEYRWAALKLRKEGSKGRSRASAATPKQLGIRKFKKGDVTSLRKVDFACISRGPGIYALRDAQQQYFYAGETTDLRSRLQAQFCESTRACWPESALKQEGLELAIVPVPSITDARLARQSRLLKWYQPTWNFNERLAV
ncbi:MAG: GIY-YIG nuclease family protein [Pirellulaceae bacterium]|nr:GIY-YIG nuclease family protein [Pirellulaceae bacterium]